ncbi:hypothetical protein HK096_002833, partial [Nowakowskiella sp. JEL0078]
MGQQPPFSQDDIHVALRVFDALNKEPSFLKLAQSDDLLKQLLHVAREVIVPSKEALKQRRAARREEKKSLDYQLLDNIGIRSQRKVKAVAYNGGSIDVPMPPRLPQPGENDFFALEDDKNVSYPEIPIPFLPDISSESANGFDISLLLVDNSKVDSEPVTSDISDSTNCHICSTSFKQLHNFYDQLCPRCADFNFAKRFSFADLKGRVCLVTGSRVKIGYCIALKLLRFGAIVIATTRFPHDAATRYSKEPDFESFKGRLNIYGIDFRDIPMVHHLCAHIKHNFGRLDVIINNAAQTVRKPPKFYEHLIEAELQPITPELRAIANVVDVYRSNEGRYIFDNTFTTTSSLTALDEPDSLRRIADAPKFTGTTPAMSANNNLTSIPGSPIYPANPTSNKTITTSSATLSQIKILETDISEESNTHFPPGLYDRDDQQIDLRKENSWTMEVGHISTMEMIECHIINSFAPYVLISELRPLMEATFGFSGEMEWDRYIVNVSAMEGQFYRPMKSIFHPHTNMAKAALNMLTRTSAKGLADVNIFMTAVDTGWITDEKPVGEWHKRGNAPPPLDEWDAAMRVLDPVLCGVRGEQKLWG